MLVSNFVAPFIVGVSDAQCRSSQWGSVRKASRYVVALMLTQPLQLHNCTLNNSLKCAPAILDRQSTPCWHSFLFPQCAPEKLAGQRCTVPAGIVSGVCCRQRSPAAGNSGDEQLSNSPASKRSKEPAKRTIL